MEMARMRKIVLLAGAVAATAASAGSLPSEGLRVHFRADDQSALNNGNGAAQWNEVTNWQGGGAAAPLLKQVTNPSGGFRTVPRFVTNGFERADGTMRPGVRFCINAAGTARYSPTTVLATDAMMFGFTGTDYTWFFAMKGMSGTSTGMGWKQFWGMADGGANKWYLGLCTRADNPSRFYAWGGAEEFGTSLIKTPTSDDDREAVKPGKRLMDVRARYLTQISSGYMNGVLSMTANWVKTCAQPVETRLAVGSAEESLEGDVWSAPPMDMGELAIYNRALNDAECVIVREALTARWGLPNENALYSGAASGYCDELVGVGSSITTGTGYIPGVVESSASSDGLTLAVASGSLAGTAGYVFAARSDDAAELVFDAALARRRYGRAWRVESTFATVPAVTLTFHLGEMGLASLSAADRAALTLVGKTGGVSAFVPVFGDVTATTGEGTVSFAFPAGALADGVYTLAFAVSPEQQSGSLPATGLRVHFRADDQAALNNGAGASQWSDVTNWQGGGAAAPLLKRVVIDGTVQGAPRFVTNGFTRADGTMAPGIRFALNETATAGRSSYTPLATDAMDFGIDKTESTWFFAFSGITAGQANLHWKGYWGMADAAANAWFYGLGTRGSPSTFNAWGGAGVIGTSFIGSVPVVDGKYLMDLRDRYKTKISVAFVNGQLISTANWVETKAQPVPCRLAIGNGYESLDTIAYATAPIDVGELVIYNRALNDAECVIVREALTARWGLPNENALYSGAASGYCDELVGVGSSATTGSGKIAGAVEASASSRGLTLAVSSGALDGADGYVLAAGCADGSSESVQEGSLRMMRLANTWRIEKATLAAYPDLALSFDLSGYALATRVAERPAKAALLKLANGAFEVVSGVTATYDAASGTLAFGCPAGTLVDGVYTVGVSGATGMTILFR